MIFNSFHFLYLFPIIFSIYYGINYLSKFFPKKITKYYSYSRISNYFLLIISYLLYMQWNPAYTLILFGVTLCTYTAAIIIEKEQAYGNKKYILSIGILLSLLPLIVFKYYNFILDNFEYLFSSIGITIGLPGLNWAIPIGLSFFTFQAVGYIWDVYYKKIQAEHNVVDYMLFVAFFPQILSGPISKANSLLPQIKQNRIFDYNKAVQGLKWLLWGFFLKTVLADRLGIYVDTVYGNYQYYSGITCFITSILYSFQIYGDFAGYSLMAIGVARLLGFDLINNFNRPYFSTSITEFWRRWHISLSTWLKDYVYIQLGGNRCSRLRSYFNILMTFLVSGIWHGANWTFIIWGLIHGIIQIFEKILNISKKTSTGFTKIGRIIITFLIVNFAWVFFRMPTIESGLGVCKKIFTEFGGTLFLDTPTLLMSICALFILITKEIFEEYYPKISLFNNRNAIIRWLTYISITSIIILLGVFDSTQFIYVNF